MENFFKKTGVTSIVSSIVFAIIGIILILNPQTTVEFVINIVGSLFILFGIISGLPYFLTKEKKEVHSNNLVYGIISFALGLIIIICDRLIGNILRVTIGCWILYSGFIRLNFAMRLKNMQIGTWKSVAFIAAIILICGLIILLNAGTIFRTIGLLILIYAVMDLIESLIFLKKASDIF